MLFYRQSGLYHTFCDRSCDKSLPDLLPPTKDLPTGFLSGAGLRLLHRKGYRRAFFFFSPSAGMRKVASGGEEGVRASRALRGTLAPSRTVTGHTGRSNRVSLPAVT